MRNLNFLPAALLMGLMACNNSSNTSSNAADTTHSAAHDTMANMHHDTAAAANVTPLPAIPVGARVTFSNLRDGQSVSSPFKVQFKIEGMRLDTAGPVVAGSGHHHLLVDAEDSIPAGTVVAKDANHLHFGKGQTETELTLPPGKHKLTLQYADGIHRSYGGQLAKTITVTVH